MAHRGLKVKFWGTRSRVSMPSKACLQHGGNTSCIQIESEEQLIVVDSGFGINNFGEFLGVKWGLDIHIFYTQFSWDRTQGLPFFLPIYFPQNNIHLYSPHAPEILQKNLDTLFDPNYSPFEGLTSMPANIHCHQLQQGQTINNFKVNFAETDRGDKIAQQSTLASYAYRFSFDKQSLVIVSDHEANHPTSNKKIIDLGRNCDLLIHDAFHLNQKTAAICGHSSAEDALENASSMKAVHCLLTNHAPQNVDQDIHEAQQRLTKIKRPDSPHFDFAKELESYDVAVKTFKAKAS